MSSASRVTRIRRVEPAARFLGNPAQRRGVHRRVEELGLARRRAHVGRAGARSTRLPRRGVHRHFVGAGLGADEAAAVLAVALAGPLQRHVQRGWPSGRATWATTVASFMLDERLVHHRGVDLSPASPGSTRSVIRTSTDVGHAVHHPAQQLPPELLVRLVLERDRGVHLPLPGVLRGERDRLAAAELLRRQHHLACGRARRCRSGAPWRAGLVGSGALMLVTCGSSAQRASRRGFGRRQSAWRRATARRRVGATFSRASGAGSEARVLGSISSGSASATGVPP